MDPSFQPLSRSESLDVPRKMSVRLTNTLGSINEMGSQDEEDQE